MISGDSELREIPEALETFSIYEFPFPAIQCESDSLTLIRVNTGAEKLFGISEKEAIGQLLSELIASSPDLNSVLSLNEAQDVLVRCGGSEIYIDFHTVELPRNQGRIVFLHSYHQEISHRSDQTGIDIRTLYRLSRKFSETLDLDRLMDSLLLESLKLVKADGGFAGLHEGSGMVCRRYYQKERWVDLNYFWPRGHGLPGWLMRYRIPYLTNDAKADRQISHLLCLMFGVTSALSIPIFNSLGEVIGFFELHNKIDGGFTQSDMEKLMAVSGIVSLSIQNALAFKRIQQTEDELLSSEEKLRALSARLETAREEERGRISREIHDELGQVLTGFKIDLAWLENRIMEPIQPIEKILEKTRSMIRLVDSTIKRVRKISTDLRPVVLDELGLMDALEWQAQEFEKRTGVPCNILGNRPEAVEMDKERSLCVFRIFQETLTNITRHAAATKVEVVIDGNEKEFLMKVVDNGKGIAEVEVYKARSLGLLGMRERANMFGGYVDIWSSPGKGTSVVVQVPLT